MDYPVFFQACAELLCTPASAKEDWMQRETALLSALQKDFLPPVARETLYRFFFAIEQSAKAKPHPLPKAKEKHLLNICNALGGVAKSLQKSNPRPALQAVMEIQSEIEYFASFPRFRSALVVLYREAISLLLTKI